MEQTKNILVPASGQSADISAARIAEANMLHKKFITSMKKSAMIAFRLGQIIYDFKMRLDEHVPWVQFVENNFDFSFQTTNSYIRIYLAFREDPAALEDKAKTEAYALSGLSGMASKTQEPKEMTPRIGYAGDNQIPLDYDIEELFSRPCLSKAKLKKYRLEAFPWQNRLWLISRDGEAIPVVQLYTTPPAGMPDIEQKELFKNVQIALEKYYERIEAYESKGIIREGGLI